MSGAPIAFLDSGIGGLPYFREAARELPNSSFVYYADTRHFPYGRQSAEELVGVVQEAVRAIVSRWRPCMIVVACNTASVVALETLRATFDLPFVGVVPAVKPASEQTRTGTIGLLATERTVCDPYVSRLIREFAPHHTVHMIAAGGLVEAVEAGEFLPDGEIHNRYLSESIRSLRQVDVDSVVLGCTHFIHVRRQIERLLGPGIAVVDSVAGVIRQITRLAGEHSCGTRATGERPQLVCSGPVPEAYRLLSREYGYTVIDESAAENVS